MSRLPTGGVISTARKSDGVPVFAIRFQALGRRQYRTLGAADAGWDERRAFAELNRTLELVALGEWQSSTRGLNDLIRQELEGATQDFSVRDIAQRVVSQADEDELRAELEELVALRVRQLMGSNRRPVLRDPLRGYWPTVGKRLRDCTSEDCDQLAAEIETAAQALLSRATVLRSLATEVRRRHVHTVGELPPRVVRNLYVVHKPTKTEARKAKEIAQCIAHRRRAA